jgi:very-short-patch-repair endonuclease
MDKSTLTQRARNLRKNSTAAAKHLWYNLRANRLGFKVLRFWNHDVFQQISSILEAIMKALHPLEIKNREAAQI